jgi:EAL domain-containing protein (putative c-di-GMP-specific phosphodiesterase class I)
VPMLTLFDKQIKLTMGQANVKRWVDDIMPLLTGDGDPLGVEGFHTHQLPLDEGPHGYEIFQKKQDNAVKVLLNRASPTRRPTCTVLEADLKLALERQELRVHYQPKVSLETGAIVDVEALVRWEQPERGLLLPDEFIALAEETGLIVPIGRWVLTEACRQTGKWQRMFPGDPPLSVCVNVSVEQLRSPELCLNVAQALRESGLQRRTLNLEITESVVIEEPATLDALKNLGAKLTVDDFGVGYSSLHRLKYVPADCLKIDRIFVSGLEKDPIDAGIVSAMMNLARVLDLEVIAEGVETAEQAQRLWDLGCRRAQGNYFSRPLPAEATERLLKGMSRREAGREWSMTDVRAK